MTHPSDIAGLSERLPADLLRAWAKTYRDAPKHLRFPSDPNAEFFPVDLDNAAAALDSLSARVKELEAEAADWFKTAAKNDARALRAEQQRDEAYERLKPFAFYFDLNDCDGRRDDDAIEVPINDLRAARDLVRRLASGPEGGAKPQESKP